jgi:hypothetical protein
MRSRSVHHRLAVHPSRAKNGGYLLHVQRSAFHFQGALPRRMSGSTKERPGSTSPRHPLPTGNAPQMEFNSKSAAPMVSAPVFEGVFLGGFECSCHRRSSGRRLDMVAATRHDEFAEQDYRRLRSLGMTACRDGVDWVRCERAGQYDFSSVLARADAAGRQGIQVIWDLMHFGWPDDVDVFSGAFPGRFARYAGAFARWMGARTDRTSMFSPMNEMSFLAWAGGDVGCMNPFELARGVELKVQLVRACIEGIEAIRAVLPKARFLHPEPLINIVPAPQHPKTWRRVQSDHLLQYQAWDMLTGKVWPGLGGNAGYLDIIGVNFYPDNQFMLDGTTVERGAPEYKPFSRMLLDVWERYARPMIIAETGSEGRARASWLEYVVDESERAMRQGCELHGITLYPVVDHPGWEDDRHCENGLWGYPDDQGERAVHEPLAEVLRARAARLHEARSAMLTSHKHSRSPSLAQVDCRP